MSEKLVQLKNNLKNLPLFKRQIFWSRVRESNPPLWLGKRPFYQ